MEFSFDWQGKSYDCEWIDNVDFESLGNVIQVYGFIFNDEGMICVVNVRHNEGGWSLPGGSPEDYDDNFEATLVREVDEEADLDIKDIKRLGYIRVVPRHDPNNILYMIRYVAKVAKVREQSKDPAHRKVPLRKFISPDDFAEVINWGDGGDIQMRKALEIIS